MNRENQNIHSVKAYLESYGINKKMLRMERYAKDYFSGELCEDPAETPCGDEAFIKAKMYEVRRFIMSIEEGNAKLMLFHHYVKGISVEHCAEMMNISRTSGFRLRKKALLLAQKMYDQRRAALGKLGKGDAA